MSKQLQQVTFDIADHNCWGCMASTTFPQAGFSSLPVLGSLSMARKSQHKAGQEIVKVVGDRKDFSRIKAYLNNHSEVEGMVNIYENGETMMLKLSVKGNDRHLEMLDFFWGHDLLLQSPLTFIDNYERWCLGAPSRGAINRSYHELKKIHPVRVALLKGHLSGVDITLKQQAVFLQAWHMGYYLWPRKISATTMSRILNIPKTVLLSHLRKAEHKAIVHHFNQVERR